MLLQKLVKVLQVALNPSDPHWVLASSLLHDLLPQDLAVIAEGSLPNKVFPSKKGYHTQLKTGLKQWTKRNSLPSMLLAGISDLCQHLWTHHVQQVTCHIAKTSITTFQQMFNGAIFHREDKQASSLRIYCPCLYHQAIESTFNDPSIFEPVSQEPTNNMANLTHGPRAQVVNSLLATSWPKRRRGSKVVDLSFRSSTPPLAPCSTSWPG